ncbi:hypothetical protein [Agrobacterium pusense]|uniref:hypothetical protein n=1 Tax=Agrobacterium pusense TaxID=648995 RepID=UPI0024472D66|nr:hypothetical protein [Agrobacterium pusense]MDH0871325.1 hypothetical protein [Agrobacterium pusense]MDH1270031.1 hypothetical protein [Agrobacterium pusense]
MRGLLRFVSASVILVVTLSGAFAGERTFGPFAVSDANPNVIALNEVDLAAGSRVFMLGIFY